MDYNTDSAREGLINAFGDSLRSDANFFLSSPCSYQYNCIAFAMGMQDRWVDNADLPWHWWPPIEKGSTVDHLKNAFRYFGFEDCEVDDAIDPLYDKIAIYQKDDSWSHAAKVVEAGIFHSKFGASYDGRHSCGDVLIAVYGSVCAMMRRLKSEAHLTDDRKGVAPGVVHLNIHVTINGEQNHLVSFQGKTYLGEHGQEVVLKDGKIYLA